MADLLKIRILRARFVFLNRELAMTLPLKLIRQSWQVLERLGKKIPALDFHSFRSPWKTSIFNLKYDVIRAQIDSLTHFD